MADDVIVTQADRDLLAGIYGSFRDYYNAKRIAAGEDDERDDLQRVARHRLASTAPSDAPADVSRDLGKLHRVQHSRNDWPVEPQPGASLIAWAADCLAALSRPTVDASEVERLREDKARVDWLQREFCDVRWISDGEDGVGLRIISHHMAKPQERVEAENWSEDLRRAIDEARAALDPKQSPPRDAQEAE